MAVDATVGGTAANSYLTVAAADAIAATELGRNAKAWLAATTEDKEAALIRATHEIDEHVGTVSLTYAAGFLGRGQALLFPRSIDVYGQYDVLAVGSAIGDPFVPSRLARAAFLQAAHLLKNADLIDDAASMRARGLSNFSNPDGTGGSLSEKENFGRMDPRALVLIGDVASGAGAYVGWIVSD